MLKTGSSEEFLTVEDESFVFRDLHQGAVYLYEAETYLVEMLDLNEILVYLKRAKVDFYTQSIFHLFYSILERILEKKRDIKSQT